LLGLKLTDLKKGQTAIIKNINLSDSSVKYLTSLGFCQGHEIKFERKAPLSDPYEYYVAGNFIALRKVDAIKIEVELVEEAK